MCELRVFLHQADNLVPKSGTGSADPYVKVRTTHRADRCTQWRGHRVLGFNEEFVWLSNCVLLTNLAWAFDPNYCLHFF